jgi:hypothetical protein
VVAKILMKMTPENKSEYQIQDLKVMRSLKIR